MVLKSGGKMFGYVTINQKQLSEEDYKIYHAFYCGLCQDLKKRYGITGQSMLNNDMTFLTILLSALYEPKEEKGEHRCLFHPGRKELLIQNQFTKYASDMTILLAYHKCMDDWLDDYSVPKKGLSVLIQSKYDKIAKNYTRQAGTVEEYMQKIRIAEKENCLDIDYMSGLTGHFLAELFVYKDDEWKDSLTRLGYYLGKFIYLMDAYEDQEKDKKKKNYNIFLLKQEEDPHFKENDKIFQILTLMMVECAKTFEKLPIIEYVSILRNILYSGVWFKYEWIRKKKEDKKDE